MGIRDPCRDQSSSARSTAGGDRSGRSGFSLGTVFLKLKPSGLHSYFSYPFARSTREVYSSCRRQTPCVRAEQTTSMNSPLQQAQPAASTIDPKLMARVAKGDHQAFSQLYDQSCTLLYSMAVRILGNREDAAELLIEVYLEIWKKVARYDVGRGTPIAWLITLTRSRAIDRLRARSTRGHNATLPLDATVWSNVADSGPSPFETQADQELRIAVGSAITSLPPAQQQAIELAYYEGLSHQEIAARLNQPLGTVKTRIKLGMSKLRETLRHYWDQGDPG